MGAFQGSPEWLAQRAGRITGSRVAAALGLDKYKTRDDLMREMVREHFGAEREFTGNEATAHGNAHEDDAIDLYERQTGRGIKYTGQHIHPEHEWLAASPDGLVGDDGLIEIKSRKPKKHIQTVLADVVPPENMAQIQAGLLVSGRAWCDYISYCGGEPLWIKRVTPDEKWFETIREVAAQFEVTAEDATAIYFDRTQGMPRAEYIDWFGEEDITL